MKPKRHHYIPRTYLEKFSTAKKKQNFVNVYDKIKKEFFYTNIINVCVEKDFYKIDTIESDNPLLIENIFSEYFENNYNKVYSILTDENKVKINTEEKELIISVLVSFFYRSPKWLNFFNRFFREVINKGFLAVKERKDKKLYFEDGGFIDFNNSSLNEIIEKQEKQSKDLWHLESMYAMLRMIDLKLDDHIIVDKIENYKYITSDNPLFFTNSNAKRPIPFDKENTIQIPIDPIYCVTIKPLGEEFNKMEINRNNHLLDSFSKFNADFVNLAQYENSEKYLIGHKKVLTTFIEEKDDLIKQYDEDNLKKIQAEYKAIINNYDDIMASLTKKR